MSHAAEGALGFQTYSNHHDFFTCLHQRAVMVLLCCIGMFMDFRRPYRVSRLLISPFWMASGVCFEVEGIDCRKLVSEINNTVYDLTDFLQHHPEQRNSILAWAGRDATPMWDKIPGRFPRDLARIVWGRSEDLRSTVRARHV